MTSTTETVPQFVMPTSSERISPFFEEIYHNYNRIWQEIIKLPTVNGDFVPLEVFYNTHVINIELYKHPYEFRGDTAL